MVLGAVYSLVLLNNTIGTSFDAVCLDGTPGAFYLQPAADAEHANDWQIYFEGGGWCYSELDCSERATKALGSSSSYPPTMRSPGGIMSDDCSVNPTFCKFNRAYLKYCDGNSFSGFREGAVKAPDGAPVEWLHFRGYAILQAALRTLVQDYGLGNAEAVHLTGCSAGGLATFIHTQFVGDFLTTAAPNMKVFKASPISGYFLEAPNVLDDPVYPDQMQYVFQMSNATSGTNQGCVEAMSGSGEEWKCNFAEHVYNYTTFPIFVLNSAYDSWQKNCIFTALPVQDHLVNGNCSAIASWKDCMDHLSHCTREQMYAIDGYESAFVRKLTNQVTYAAPGNGAFVHSCITHCEAQGDQFATFAINGVTMQQAVAAWWSAPVTDPASSHTYLPCLLNLDATECNPSCSGSEGRTNARAVPNALVPGLL